MIRVNFKDKFNKYFPWHYDPLKLDHNDYQDYGQLVFDFTSLADFAFEQCKYQNRIDNKKGFRTYYNDDHSFDYDALTLKSDAAKEMIQTWIDSGWTLENSCYYEFHDEELGDFYKPLLNAYFEKWGELKNPMLRLFVKPPMTALGLHCDTYNTFTKKYNCSTDNVIRIHTFIEDWQWGHYTLIGNHVCHQYTAGQSQRISENIFHCSGNIGFNPLITMNITGIKY